MINFNNPETVWSNIQNRVKLKHSILFPYIDFDIIHVVLMK